jgi:hypothetical protein
MHVRLFITIGAVAGGLAWSFESLREKTCSATGVLYVRLYITINALDLGICILFRAS